MDWDDRFRSEGYLFGTEPAAFLAAHADLLIPGQTALCVADGEGRNSVFLARQGLRVTAWDGSAVAVEKARALAGAQEVDVAYAQADAAQFDWDQTQYDALVAIFIQFAPPVLRDAIFAGMIRATRPGGLILLHGYTPEQLDYRTGGPSAVENLYTETILRDAFGGEEILELRSYEAELAEGSRHVGRSALIDLVVRKR